MQLASTSKELLVASKSILLAALDQNNNVTIAKLSSTAQGVRSALYPSKVALGAGVTSDGTVILLKLNTSGEVF